TSKLYPSNPALSTLANADSVGASHACEQGSHFSAESFSGMPRSPQRTDRPPEDHLDISNPRSCRSRPCLRTRLTLRRGILHGHGPFPRRADSPPEDPTSYSNRPATAYGAGSSVGLRPNIKSVSN